MAFADATDFMWLYNYGLCHESNDSIPKKYRFDAIVLLLCLACWHPIRYPQQDIAFTIHVCECW